MSDPTDGDRTTRALTDLDLLQIEAEVGLDERGRLPGMCGIKLSASRHGQLLFVGSEVPDDLVPALTEAVERSPLASSPDREFPGLAACRAILEPACAPLRLHAGPYYVLQRPVRASGQAAIVRSDGPPDARLRALNPGNWEPDEWDDLLDGTLGPWAMAVADGRVVSICHTPRPLTPQAAECGVWTHPEYRGRGLAADVTASWADILRPSGRVLFYSTSAENLSSQRVAARLRLRPIGWIWTLARVEPEPGDGRHPLSRRRS